MPNSANRREPSLRYALFVSPLYVDQCREANPCNMSLSLVSSSLHFMLPNRQSSSLLLFSYMSLFLSVVHTYFSSLNSIRKILPLFNDGTSSFTNYEQILFLFTPSTANACTSMCVFSKVGTRVRKEQQGFLHYCARVLSTLNMDCLFILFVDVCMSLSCLRHDNHTIANGSLLRRTCPLDATLKHR